MLLQIKKGLLQGEVANEQGQIIQAVLIRLHKLLGLAIELKDFVVVANLAKAVVAERAFPAGQVTPMWEAVHDMLFDRPTPISLCPDLEYLCEIPTLVQKPEEGPDEVLLHETLLCSSVFSNEHSEFYRRAYAAFGETFAVPA
jgi:hypothetical protein